MCKTRTHLTWTMKWGMLSLTSVNLLVKMRLEGLPNDTMVTRVQPSRQNCLAEESRIDFFFQQKRVASIVSKDGKVFQKLHWILRLRNVKCRSGKLQLHQIDIHGSNLKGFVGYKILLGMLQIRGLQPHNSPASYALISLSTLSFYFFT